MDLDLVVRNGLLVIPGTGICRAALAVKDGKIVGICSEDGPLKARKVIDARGNYVLPGVIQPHAHLGKLPQLEDYATETRSAAIGGVTTLMEFYRDWGDYGQIFPERVKLADSQAYVDYSFHFQIMTDEHLEKIPTYVNLGISSFKFIMTNRGEQSGGKGPSEYNDGLLYATLAKLRDIPGAVACIHAENYEIIKYHAERLRRLGRDDLQAWSESRPPYSESESINRALYFGRITQCPLYIVHMTTKEGLQLVREHRRNGFSRVYAETCPQYLTHDVQDSLGRTGKFTPPLQTKADNEAFWDGVKNGDVDTLGVDLVARKPDPEEMNIWERTNTPREAATALSVLISEGFHKRGLDMERIARITSYNAARIFNLYPAKGTLGIGSDADFVIVDVNREKKVTKDIIQSFSDFSVYEGWTLKGWPIMTVCRGQVVMAEGEIVGGKGWGNFVAQRAN